MDVIVPDDQLSLAIGRKGQNVRLAVQLTGWRIDIKSESKMRELAQWLSEAVSVVEGCGDADAELLLQQGITSLEDLARLPARAAHARCRASTRRARARSSSARASSRSARRSRKRRRARRRRGSRRRPPQPQPPQRQRLLPPPLRRPRSPRRRRLAGVPPASESGGASRDERAGVGPTRERMAKIRAYKLAEELGIDRAEFVERAAAAGHSAQERDGLARRGRGREAAQEARRHAHAARAPSPSGASRATPARP